MPFSNHYWNFKIFFFIKYAQIVSKIGREEELKEGEKRPREKKRERDKRERERERERGEREIEERGMILCR